ncbi:MAG TPA: hypothetical protein PLJ85_03755, partial [Candidatus Cloacimonas sp.]|nr:hypothetical protein [Candidatus Cloacimonas sp.]
DSTWQESASDRKIFMHSQIENYINPKIPIILFIPDLLFLSALSPIHNLLNKCQPKIVFT